jgi:CDP-glucose 4,6-dehydratase
MKATPSWRGRQVLVTGATGLLGSGLIDDLLKNRVKPVALVRDRVPDSNFVLSGNDLKATIVHGCLEDYALVERTLNEYEIDTVFHLGAQTIVTTANRSPLSTFEANIKGTWNVLEACRNSKLVRRIVVASSDKAYGPSPSAPYTEDQPLRGEHPYDVSKSCADLLAQSYFKTYGLPLAITRCGNIYGGGDLNFNRIVPGTIKALLADEAPIIRSDGTLVRDYFYVKDAVSACLLVADQLDRDEVRGQAFNFSNESPLSVLRVVELISGLMGKRLKPQILSVVSGEIKDQRLSSDKARSVLNWRPRYSIEEGLKETIAWYESYLGRKA